MSELFGGLSTPKWLSGSDIYDNIDTAAANLSGRLGQGLATNQQNRIALAKAAQTTDKLQHIATGLDGATTPTEIQSRVAENPAWMLDPSTAPFVGNILKQADTAIKIQNGGIAAKIAASQITDFTKQMDSLNSSDPASVAKIRAMTPLGDGTPSESMWKALGDAKNAVANKAAADAAARGDIASTTITPAGVTTTYRPPTAPSGQKLLDEIDKVKADAQAAKDSGDDAEYQRLTKRAQTLNEMLPTHGEETMTTGYDDQGRPIVSVIKGGKGSSSEGTVGTQSLAQQNIIKYGNALQLINGLQKNLRAQDVGVAGVGGEMVLDRGLSQLYPELANKQRIGNRTALSILGQSLMRQVTDDTRRFTAQDREDIAAALPSNGAFESLQDAKQKMDAVKGIIIDRARNYAERTGTPIPDYAKSKDEIASEFKRKKSALNKAVENGNLTRAEADAEIKKENDAAVSALTKYF